MDGDVVFVVRRVKEGVGGRGLFSGIM